MSGPTEMAQLNPCGCCESDVEEPARDNAPGQSALSFRIGTHPTFLARMIARLSRWRIPDGDNEGQRPLAKLTTRDSDDPAIALLDAWATAADVLTFYQERIADEGYLHTADERRSVLELARAIGYELSPGVSAGVYLAFTVDDVEGAPGESEVPSGTQVQSIPAEQGELPQTFETDEDFTAYAEWNEIWPQMSLPQTVTLESTELYLKGLGTNLKVGDMLLLVATDGDDTVQGTALKRVNSIETDSERDYTLVTLKEQGTSLVATEEVVVVDTSPVTVDLATMALAVAETGPMPFSAYTVDPLLGMTLTESELTAIMDMNAWNADDLLGYLDQASEDSSGGNVQVFALREKASVFGHNAPYYGALPADTKSSFYNWDKPSGWQIWKDSLDRSDENGDSASYYDEADVYLERVVSGIAEDSWAVLQRTDGHYMACKIAEAIEGSIAGFAISSKTSGLKLADENGDDLEDNNTDKPRPYKVRNTTVYVKSEALELAKVPVTHDLEAGDDELVLNGMVLSLQKEQPVALTGEQADAEGVERSEIRLLEEITHSGGHTTLHFTEGLAYSYLRDTVTINANVVHATHGETVTGEVLGGGDGAQPHQRFKLKKPPLTHVSAATASGAESALSVRVNDVEWAQVDSLYGLDGRSRSYIVRLSDSGADGDGGDVHIIFGDGKAGARLPTGQENVVATYRSGTGSDGEVGAGSLTLLKTRPFGMRGVTNPQKASGAADPETLDDARDNAPLTVLTLGRIVSLRDFEDFCRAFAGIGKAQAVALWSGEAQIVHITIADADGDAVDSTSDLYQNLLTAIDDARDPLQEVRLASYQRLYFNLSTRVLIDSAYEWESVKGEIENVLSDTFAFEERAFGQPVTAAEIVSLIHEVAGVVAVDIDALYPITDPEEAGSATFSSVLVAETARFDAGSNKILPAQLLLINSITLTEMTS